LKVNDPKRKTYSAVDEHGKALAISGDMTKLFIAYTSKRYVAYDRKLLALIKTKKEYIDETVRFISKVGPGLWEKSGFIEVYIEMLDSVIVQKAGNPTAKYELNFWFHNEDRKILVCLYDDGTDAGPFIGEKKGQFLGLVHIPSADAAMPGDPDAVMTEPGDMKDYTIGKSVDW
jgi:hypothetical protein